MIDLEEFNKLSQEEQKEILSKRIPVKKVRCKNWPNCNDPNCIFTHPTETVNNNFYIYILFLVSLFSKLFIWR